MIEAKARAMKVRRVGRQHPRQTRLGATTTMRPETVSRRQDKLALSECDAVRVVRAANEPLPVVDRHWRSYSNDLADLDCLLRVQSYQRPALDHSYVTGRANWHSRRRVPPFLANNRTRTTQALGCRS